MMYVCMYTHEQVQRTYSTHWTDEQGFVQASPDHSRERGYDER